MRFCPEVRVEKVISALTPKKCDVYVLKSTDSGDLYIGSSTDVERRLGEHNAQGKRKNLVKVWQLLYKEEFQSVILARKREKFFKTGDGRKVLRNKGVI